MRAVAGERGSVLMLAPVGVLVLLVLAAIACDTALVHAAQRELANRASAAANDVTALAVDDATLYAGGRITIDAGAAAAHVDATFDTAGFDAVDVATDVAPDGRSVTVTATGTVRTLFLPAVGGGGDRRVTASATAFVAG